MYRISLACDGVSLDQGPQVAADVYEEFSHRPWQQIISCTWQAGILVLVGQSDIDRTGEALADEFSDAIAANWGGGYSVRIVSITEESGNAA